MEIIASTVRAQNTWRRDMVRKVGLTRSDEATNLLLQWIAQDPGGNLANQSIKYFQYRNIYRALSEDEMAALQWRLQNLGGYDAAQAARVLGKATHNNAVIRAKWVIASYKREIENPTPPRPTDPGYLSEPVGLLNRFLLAIADINDPVTTQLLNQELLTARSERLRKWLTVALGFAGDEKVAAELKSLVISDADSSVRVVALTAYAHSAREKAVPFLETFLNDKTETGGKGHLVPNYGLRSAAQSGLAILRKRP